MGLYDFWHWSASDAKFVKRGVCFISSVLQALTQVPAAFKEAATSISTCELVHTKHALDQYPCSPWSVYEMHGTCVLALWLTPNSDRNTGKLRSKVKVVIIHVFSLPSLIDGQQWPQCFKQPKVNFQWEILLTSVISNVSQQQSNLHARKEKEKYREWKPSASN